MAEPTFQQLTEQVQHLTQRVALLEVELGLRRGAPQNSQPEPVAASRQPLPRPVEETAGSHEVPAWADSVPEGDLETSFGLRWVNRIGAVTLILGIAFFFRYAVENNWIGEAARVLIGAVAGLLLLAGGEWAFRRDQRVFAQGVTGAGASALYLSCYAGFGAYNLLPVLVAFGLMSLTTALAAYLSVRYGSQSIAVLAVFGGFLVPLLADDPSRSIWSIPVYLVFLNAAFLKLAELRGWSFTQAVALAGTALFTLGFADTPLLVVLPIYYLLFALLPDGRLFVGVHILLLGRATALPITTLAYFPELLLLSFAGLMVLSWRKWFHLATLLVTAAAVSWFLATSVKPGPLLISFVTLGTLFLMFFGFCCWRAVRLPNLFSFGEMVALPSTAVFFLTACYVRLAGWGDSWAALLALAVAVLYLGLAAALRNNPEPNPAAAISLGAGLACFTLSIPLQFHSYTVTMAWAVEGAALVWIAAQRRYFFAQIFGMAALACAVIHYSVLEAFLPSSTPLWNARFLTAVVLALALFLSAIWSRDTRVPTWMPGVAGHLVLLSGLSLEVDDWAQWVYGARSSGPQSAALSILFALYAVILVALGTRERSAGSRYMGLGLIALVVVKLYLYDIWQLDLVYRFIAFAALGALLLTMSFFYSRYRASLSSWLVPTPPGASEAHPPPPQE